MYMKGDRGYFRNMPDYSEAQSADEQVRSNFNSILSDTQVENVADVKTAVNDYNGDYDKISAKAEEFVQAEQNALSIRKETYVLSNTGKVLIAVYTFLFLAIFAFIIFNANYLKGLNKKIDVAQTEVDEMEQAVKEKQLELDLASSPETIIEKAIELGMVPRL